VNWWSQIQIVNWLCNLYVSLCLTSSTLLHLQCVSKSTYIQHPCLSVCLPACVTN
jgi:hypothetical protein